jgi:hypothetical protein
VLTTIALTLPTLQRASAAVTRTCLGMVETEPGKRWDPTFKGRFKCTPRNLISCGNGSSCPRGGKCLYRADGGPAGCAGVATAGPICNTKPCPVGYLCNPAAKSCYDPRISYTCGVASCAISGRYLPGDRCYRCYVQRGGR